MLMLIFGIFRAMIAGIIGAGKLFIEAILDLFEKDNDPNG